jgi:hypothetical protein
MTYCGKGYNVSSTLLVVERDTPSCSHTAVIKRDTVHHHVQTHRGCGFRERKHSHVHTDGGGQEKYITL